MLLKTEIVPTYVILHLITFLAKSLSKLHEPSPSNAIPQPL